MNTVKIGDKFEAKSLDIITRVIKEGQLGHLTSYLRIFQKQGYYSNLRKKKIKFDLTIEVWPPGATRYVLLYIIECKDYDKRVPVSKIEDFHSKILQVGGVNVKGIFISNSPLQEGGFNIAESVGMMVIQGESSEDYKIILHKKTNNLIKDQIPIIKKTLDNSLINHDIENVERLIDKNILNAFNQISNKLQISYNLDKLSKIDIELIAEQELNKINPQLLLATFPINQKIIRDYLKNNYAIILSYISNDSKSLGFCDIKENTIGINNTIRESHRELFILSHEFGHYLLHQKLSIGQDLYDLFEDTEYNFRTGKNDIKNPKHWIEWQANYFASSFILPKVPFVARLLIF